VLSDDEIFFAFASSPGAIGSVIRATADKLNKRGMKVHPWTDNDISGKPLADPIFRGIDEAPFVVADVTRPNFNVYFEVGYGIGRRKKVHLVSNTGIVSDKSLIREVGIFDTLGFKEYQTVDELSDVLWSMAGTDPIPFEFSRDSSPLYIVEPEVHTEALTTIISAVKKRARIRYRSFNPAEHIRLSPMDAIQNVASSAGVLIPLLSKHFVGHDEHNLRCAFVAGLAIGMEIPTLLLIERGEEAPLDIRDMANVYRNQKSIQEHIAAFVPQVVERFQETEFGTEAATTNLTELSIGDPAAENEMLSLGTYYVETDAYGSALRGDINLVLGRKGMGKTALFTQVRDKLRSNRQNVVIDLKPEGYQLLRLKEEVLRFVTDGTREHLVTALWEYVLYLEICYKLLEKDQNSYKRDHKIYQLYVDLSEAYQSPGEAEQGDFSERLYELSSSIQHRFEELPRTDEPLRLRAAEVTRLIYQHDLHQLRDRVAKYLLEKQGLWILFDNLDKGWPAQGIGRDEVVIIRCLIDAAKKIQRELGKRDIECHNIVFIRNDIFELLISQAADFGKESRSSLDWSGKDFLREVVRSRLTRGKSTDFADAWAKYFVSHVNGEDSYYHIEQRTLMRPRNIIKILAHCKGDAIVRKLERIDEISIHNGLSEFSNDIVIEADREISDVEPLAKGVIYKFMRESPELFGVDVKALIEEGVPDGSSDETVNKIFYFLLYFGFLGIKSDDDEVEFIYDYYYNMQLMQAAWEKAGEDCIYCIHPAFWPALKIKAG
jgi:hypothetical protein